MHPGRAWVVLLAFYLVVDFSDPAIPGVFFFETDNLFVDTVIQTKTDSAAHITTALVVPAWRPTSIDRVEPTATLAPKMPAGPVFLGRKPREHLPAQSSPPSPPSSPDAR